MDGATSGGRSSALLWSAVFAPGLICVGLGVFVLGSTLVIALGIVLLVAPLAVQMFGPDWSRETIPEGHHHHADHDDVHHEDAHHDDAGDDVRSVAPDRVRAD